MKLDFIAADPKLKQYVRPLEKLLYIRLLQQVCVAPPPPPPPPLIPLLLFVLSLQRDWLFFVAADLVQLAKVYAVMRMSEIRRLAPFLNAHDMERWTVETIKVRGDFRSDARTLTVIRRS